MPNGGTSSQMNRAEPEPASTRGMRSPQCLPMRAVQRSGGSTTCESAETRGNISGAESHEPGGRGQRISCAGTPRRWSRPARACGGGADGATVRCMADSDLFHLLVQAHPWHGIDPGKDCPVRVTAYVEIVPTDTV